MPGSLYIVKQSPKWATVGAAARAVLCVPFHDRASDDANRGKDRRGSSPIMRLISARAGAVAPSQLASAGVSDPSLFSLRAAPKSRAWSGTPPRYRCAVYSALRRAMSTLLGHSVLQAL